MGEDNTTLPPASVPSFTVSYASPIDAEDIVVLVCTRSIAAKARADCRGEYNTSGGHQIKVTCDISLGAASGPGCETRIVGSLGERENSRRKDYLNPPEAAVPTPTTYRAGKRSSSTTCGTTTPPISPVFRTGKPLTLTSLPAKIWGLLPRTPLSHARPMRSLLARSPIS